MQTVQDRPWKSGSPLQRLCFHQGGVVYNSRLVQFIPTSKHFPRRLDIQVWRNVEQVFIKKQRAMFGIMLYFWWNIWKEWNRKTFQLQQLHPRQVAFLVKDEVQQFQLGDTTSHPLILIFPFCVSFVFQAAFRLCKLGFWVECFVVANPAGGFVSFVVSYSLV